MKINFLDFEIDRLTRSIENIVTGDSFAMDISHLVKADIKQVSKKNGWVFNWKIELVQPVERTYIKSLSPNVTRKQTNSAEK